MNPYPHPDVDLIELVMFAWCWGGSSIVGVQGDPTVVPKFRNGHSTGSCSQILWKEILILKPWDLTRKKPLNIMIHEFQCKFLNISSLADLNDLG